MAKWMLSARSHHTRRDFMFNSLEGETVVDTYRRIKEQAAKLREKLGPSYTVDIISRSKAFKPQESAKKTGRGQLWCPYCIKYRYFVEDTYLGVNRCHICGISDQDFWVRRHNKLWK